MGTTSLSNDNTVHVIFSSEAETSGGAASKTDRITKRNAGEKERGGREEVPGEKVMEDNAFNDALHEQLLKVMKDRRHRCHTL